MVKSPAEYKIPENKNAVHENQPSNPAKLSPLKYK
jgi:hypothetical protein